MFLSIPWQADFDASYALSIYRFRRVYALDKILYLFEIRVIYPS